MNRRKIIDYRKHCLTLNSCPIQRGLLISYQSCLESEDSKPDKKLVFFDIFQTGSRSQAAAALVNVVALSFVISTGKYNKEYANFSQSNSSR